MNRGFGWVLQEMIRSITMMTTTMYHVLVVKAVVLMIVVTIVRRALVAVIVNADTTYKYHRLTDTVMSASALCPLTIRKHIISFHIKHFLDMIASVVPSGERLGGKKHVVPTNHGCWFVHRPHPVPQPGNAASRSSSFVSERKIKEKWRRQTQVIK